jgi:hypothetical protein
VLLLSALGSLGVCAGCAGTKEAGQDIQAAVPFVEQTQEGVVMGIQSDAIAIRSADPNVDAAWFKLQPDTTIERDGQRVSLEDISEGAAVRVDFEPATGAERTFKVELLTGQKAQEVQRKVQYQEGMHEAPPPPPDSP